MSFITTANGHEAEANRPTGGVVNIADIAWSLAQINRFNGHARRPYSVAEHSLLVCEIAERELGLGIAGQLAALLHDAHEAYTGDLHSPGKAAVGEAWFAWEGSWMRTVRLAFSVTTISAAFMRELRQADLMALATERRDLVATSPTAWPALHGIQPVGWVNLMATERVQATWDFWRDRFADRYGELDFARNGAHRRAGH